MTTTAREPDGPPLRHAGKLALLPLLALLSIYPGAYVHARLTHRLVNYGSFIARRDAMHGLGFSRDEIVFFPCIQIEETLRGL